MKHYARVLLPMSRRDLRAAATALGAEPTAADRLTQRAGGLAVRLQALPPAAAARLSVSLDAAGGVGLVGLPTADAGASAVICGTRVQLDLALRALGAGDDAARAVAAEVQAAREREASPSPPPIQCGRTVFEFGRRTHVMAVVNVTPDSFSGDGTGADEAIGMERVRQALDEGADIVDIGGESTRPGSEPVSLSEELRRTIPVVAGAVERGAVVSIDTAKAEVARAAAEAGAQIINDVTALRGDPEMARVAADAGCPVILMHMHGRPRTMQDAPHYDDVVSDVYRFLADRVEAAVAAGISEDNVVIDPGFGFGKRLEHNLELLRRLRELRSLGRPILVGTSRKSMIGTVLDLPVEQRVEGTAATVACAIQGGADIVRVHDVEAMVRVARMTDAISRPGGGCDE